MSYRSIHEVNYGSELVV